MVYFNKPIRFNAVKKILGDVVHIEKARGSCDQCIQYCQKLDSRAEGTEPVEWGERPAQGRRTDIETAATAIVEGSSLREVAMEYPATYARFGRGLRELRRLVEPIRTEPPYVCYRWGPPGTGKTRFAYETYGVANVFCPVDSGSKFWWDGYDPRTHTCVLFDDIDGSHSRNQLLRWLDRYPTTGEIKGGTVSLAFTHCVITSNVDPRYLWRNCSDFEKAAFWRRVTDVTEVVGNTKATTVPVVDTGIDELLAELYEG